MVIEEMFGGQHCVDERKRAGQVRAPQMNRSGRKRRSSCADEEVCSNLVIRKIKKLLTRPASLEISLLLQQPSPELCIDWRGDHQSMRYALYASPPSSPGGSIHGCHSSSSA